MLRKRPLFFSMNGETLYLNFSVIGNREVIPFLKNFSTRILIKIPITNPFQEGNREEVNIIIINRLRGALIIKKIILPVLIT